MGVTIRLAEERDVDRILELLSQILKLHHGGRPDFFREEGGKYDRDSVLEMAEHTFAAEVDGVLRGYAMFKVKNRGGPAQKEFTTLYVDDLCVEDGFQGAGIGRALMDACKERARELGCHNIELNVWEFNEKARKFYEKIGFTTQKRGMEMLVCLK
ncbi:N-acetyltransferase [Clostridia bacterium]|nr:N-acetyltransferase [Clostridia bacterium]